LKIHNSYHHFQYHKKKLYCPKNYSQAYWRRANSENERTKKPNRTKTQMK